MSNMKKILTVFAVLIALSSVQIFAQTEQTSQSENNEFSESNINLSLINEKFLIHSSEYFPKSSYQTPNGKSVSHKEATKLLLSQPESESYAKQYKTWATTSLTLVGICCVAIATDVIFTLNDNLPYRNTVQNVSSITIGSSLLCALLSSEIASSRFNIALDKYNLKLLEIND